MSMAPLDLKSVNIPPDELRFLVFQDQMPVDLEDSIQEWKRSTNGQIGLWELADIIVEARHGQFH